MGGGRGVRLGGGVGSINRRRGKEKRGDGTSALRKFTPGCARGGGLGAVSVTVADYRGMRCVGVWLLVGMLIPLAICFFWKCHFGEKPWRARVGGGVLRPGSGTGAREVLYGA